MYLIYKALPPVLPFTLFFATNESNFQHYKAGFIAYLITSVAEYALTRKSVQDPSAFFYSRLSAAVFFPWVIFLLWYLAPAIIGQWQTLALEAIYANIILILATYFTIVFERGMAQISYSREFKAVLWILFCASILLYIVFTLRLPWADVFVEPNWR